MPPKQHACYTVTCDVCGAEYESTYLGYVQHHESPEDAAEDARGSDWAATDHAERVVCTAEDEQHQGPYAEVLAAHDAQYEARRAARIEAIAATAPSTVES